MNTNDLIKTAQYLDKLGSYKIADKVENKLIRLAKDGKLYVDPKIRNEYNFIKKLLENIKEGKTSSYGYNTINFYPSGDCPYITGHTTVKPTVEALNKRLKFITSTEFIKGFNLLRADHLENTVAPNANAEIHRQNALNKAKELKNNANSGATSPFLSESGSSKPGTGKPGTGKPGTGKPGASSSGKPGTGKPGTGKPGTGKPGTGTPGGGTSGGSPSPPNPSNATTNSTMPASPEEGKSSLVSMLDELDVITADENVWKANVNKVIPKLRKANNLFTEIYDSLSPKEARLLGNRLDMITLANTTFTGRFSGMR